MASWLSREINDDGKHLPPLKQKSKIPVKVTRLSSDSDKSSSSEDEADKKRSLSKDSVEKLQSKRPSRIPIVVGQKKNKIEKDKLPMKNVGAVMGEKPLERDSGINLRETRGKQAKAKFSTSPPTAAKRSSRKPAKESTPQVRRRIPRQLTPLETIQVSKDEKEPRNETSASDSSSAARTAEITPDFECNIARVEDGNLMTGAESNMSGSEFGDDFERYSVSSDEQALPNVPPWLREAVKEQKAARLAEDEKNASKSANDTTTELGTGHKDSHEDLTVTPYPAPKDICTDFVADELDKIIADLSVMNADMTDEEHADAMASLLLLRDDAREREEAMKDTKYDISENNKVVKDDANITSFVDDAVKPVFDAENKMDEKATSDEEFDCSSVTVSSEGERKIAALEEKSRRLKAQFAEENRLAIESMDKIREEIKQSQEREDAITNDMEEMRHRQDEIKQDLRRLDEMSKTREREEEKWKEKIDRKKKKIARRLEKVRADRLKYQQETEAEKENLENEDHSAFELQNEAGRQVEKQCTDPTKTTTSCVKEDMSNKILYEPHEVKDYSSVKQLEKKRKELRRLEKMEKKAIKREKLEQRERKKIEKEKRKVARKLEKLRAKNLTVTEENLESSQCVNNQLKGVSSVSLPGNSEEAQTVNQTEHQTTYFTATCDVGEIEQDASNKASDGYPADGQSSLHLHKVRSVSDGEKVALGNSELNISRDIMKKPVLESTIYETEVAEVAPEEVKTISQRSFRFQNDKDVATEGSVEDELEKKPKESSHSDEQRRCTFGDTQMDNEDAWDDVEIDCLEKEDTLKDISVELFSIEEELDLIEPHNNPEGGGPQEKHFLSEEYASKPAGMEYDESCSLPREILEDNPSEMEAVSSGTVGPSEELKKATGFTTNTSTLESAAECLDKISVCSEMAQDGIPPLYFNGKETLAKSDDFDEVDGGCHDNDRSVQCFDDTDVELSTRSKEKKLRTGDSLEKSIPRSDYFKADGNDVPDECLIDGNDDSINMTLSDDSFDHRNPSRTGNSSSIANEPSPLIRKVSGRFTPGGLEPFFHSPGTGEFNSIFEDTVPLEEEVEANVRGEDCQFPPEENSSPHHLETGSFEDETTSWSHDYGMSFNDLPKEMQEALLQQYAACTDVEGAEKVEVEIVYEEVSRRSSDPNSFSIVCEEASVQTCDQEDWTRQDIEEEIDDVSLEEPSFSEEYLVKRDEMIISMKQASVEVLETKTEMELGESRAKAEYDHHERRDSIDERGVMEFSQPPFTASEALSGESSSIHSPDLLGSTAEGYDKSALPEELKPVPMKAASTSNTLENSANSKFQRRSHRSSSHKKAYNSQSIANPNFEEDDFIAQFDDFLSEVEEALQIEKNDGDAKTVETSKVVGALAQSTVQSPDSEMQESMEKSRGLKKDTPSRQEIDEDNGIPLVIADSDTDNKPVVESKEAFHYTRSLQSDNGEGVEKAFLDRNLHPVIDIPKELDSAALSNDTLQSDYCSNKDDYTSEGRASSVNNMLENDDQKLFLGSENKEVHNRGEVSEFAYSMEGPLAETKVQDEQRLLMGLCSTNKKNQERMEEDAQNYENSSDEKAGYCSSKTAIDVSSIATETSQADGAVARPGDETSDSKIQDLLRNENTEVEKSHSISGTGDDPDSWGSINDKLPTDSHYVTGGRKESVFGVPDFCEVYNEGPDQKNEEQDKEALEHDTSPVSALETTAALQQHRRDSLLSPRQDDNILVVGEQVKSSNDEACALEIEKDTKLDSVGDLAPNSVDGVKKGVFSGHQHISVTQVDDKVLAVGEELNTIEYHEQSSLHVTPGMGSKGQKDNKATASDVKATGGDGLVSADSIMDQRLDVSLKGETVKAKVDTPSKEVSQLPHPAKRFLLDKGKVKKANLAEDEFIDDFDRLLDEAEENIRIEESMSSAKSNPHSSESKEVVEEIEDQSIIDVETLDESITSVTDIGSEESVLSSCDEEVATIHDGILEVISEDEEEPDSWDALDDLVDRRFQNREFRWEDAFTLNEGENRMSDELRRAQYARSIAAVVNISEHLLHQELLGALKAAMCDVNDENTLEDQLKASVSSPRNETFSRTKDSIPNNDANILTEGNMKTDVINQVKGVIHNEEKATVADAIEELNKLHSKVTDIREQLNRDTGTKGQRFVVKTEIDSVPILLNSIRALDSNIGDMAEEFKQATEKSNKASTKSDEDVDMEMLEESRKENAKMLVEVTVIQEEVEAFKKKNESLHSELETTKAELKRLQSRDEYKQRELTNLKNDFERKEKKWEGAEENLENALTDKQELMDDVEYLEDSLRFSRVNNETLNARVDELNETIKELKKQAKMDKRHEYGHLREEAELLKGSLELCNQREMLLRCQVDGLEAEVSHFKNCEQTLKSNLKTIKNEKSRIIQQLEEQLATAENENARMIAELSNASDKEKLLSELKDENMRVIKELDDQLNKLTEENSTLTAELSKVSETNSQMTELKSETTKVIKQLEDQLATLEKENSMLVTELSKVSEKDNEMSELKSETSKFVRQLEDQLATLRKEKSMLVTELSKVSEKDIERSKLKSETSKVVKQLEDQLATLRNENSTLTAELSKMSEKDNQMTELKRETSSYIEQLEDELATLRKKNSLLATELSKASEKDNQMSELKSETSKFIKQLEDQLAKLSKENYTLASEQSKISEKDKQLTELWKQVGNLTTQNKLLQNEALEVKTRFADELPRPLEETSELGESSMRSRRSRRSKSSDIRMLRKRVRQNEQEIEFLGRFIRQRGLEFGQRPRYHIDQDMRDELSNVKDTLNHEQENERDKQNISQVQEMEKVIEGIRKSLRQTENDLQQTKGALTLRTERTEYLERRAEETEMLLEEKSKRLRQNEYNLKQTNATLREQLERSATLENQLEGMEKARDSAITSNINKDQELEEAYRRIRQNDERIDNLIHELKQERSDKECLKRAIEVTECNAVREKGLSERLRELENQINRTEELKETTLASLMDKQQELEQLYRSVSNKDAQIDDLILELKQERLDKDCLQRAIAVTECNANRERRLLERATQLEKQLQEMEELREKTLTSLKNKEETLEQANVKIDELNQGLKREISDKECLRRAVEVTECNAKREKELLEKQTAELEIELREMEKLQERTQSSLKNKESELQQVYSSLSTKDVTIDELKQELKQERSEKRELRKAMEITGSNVQRQKILLDDKEEEVERLKEQLCDYEKKVEKLNVNLKQMRKELEVAEDLLAYGQNNVRNVGISSRIQYDSLEFFPIKQGRNSEESFREMGSLMGHVAERLRKLLQKQKEVDSSATLLKEKEAETKRVVERLREELNQRDDEIENLKSSLLKSVNEAECTRGRQREVEYENIDLKKALGDEKDQVKKLEILVKQLEGDVERAQNSLKEKETTLEETKESLQLKSSLVTSMEAKLCLRDNEIEELRVANKERGLELERVQTSLKEVKKELEISSSIITKQNEEFVYLRSHVKRKSWDADKMKFRVEPTQDEAKLLSIKLECAKNDKANLSRELAAATSRLEDEQVLADRQKKALQEQVKSGLEDLKAKTKLIWDMKMSLQESTARISRLEAEKLEQEGCFRDYKRKLERGVKRLKQSLNVANENESLLQSRIGSTGREMSELRRENQRLKFELLRKETGEFPQDGVEGTSSGLFKQTDLDTKRQEAITRLKHLETEIKGDMTSGCHGEMHEPQESSDTRMEGRHLDKCFSSQGVETFNGSAVLLAGDRIMTDPATPRSANKISILLCTA